MNPNDQRSIARIATPDGFVLGAGVLISKSYVLTCAHVVESVLSLPKMPGKTPAGHVMVDFPLCFMPNQKPALSACVLFWAAPSHDVAVLKLQSDDHPGIPTHLLNTQDLLRHPYQAFGFPASSAVGNWNEGIILAPNAKGYVQLQSNNVTGIPIEPGFSGTPLWDEQVQAAVGIVAEYFGNLDKKTAYMIPTFTLLNIWPDLAKYIEQPESSDDTSGPSISLESDEVGKVWSPGKTVRVGKIPYIVYQAEETPPEAKNRYQVERIAKVRQANASGAGDFWIKQVMFRRGSGVVTDQRRLLRQIRDEYKLLQELNNNRQPGFPTAVYLDDSDTASASLVFKANPGRTLAQTYGYTLDPNAIVKTMVGKKVSGQRARLLLQGAGYLCTMLAALHHQGRSHRDLNLETILYTSDNRSGPRLLLRDLGLATHEVAPGEGHPDYAAPEQRRSIDFRDIGPATDIYQLGAVLYHLLCAEPPDKITVWPPSTYNPDLPFEIDDILDRALQEDCKQRWPKIEEFGSALLNVAKQIHQG